MSAPADAGRGLLGEMGATAAGAAPPIAYLGSSVTVQRRDGYRTRLHAALCERSGRPHRPVFAEVGGVGSISGLFLLDDLVLRHRPGLCSSSSRPPTWSG